MDVFKKSTLLGLFSFMVIFGSCTFKEKIERPNYVIIHQKSEPKQLNPVNSRDAGATVMYYGIFQELINADYKTMEMAPVLAKERPTINRIEGTDLVEMLFEIRDEAVWDNGEPITGEDVVFSLKVIKIPQSQCPHRKPVFEFIKNIEVDEGNPKKFKIIGTAYMLAEQSMSDLHIIPSYIYDENDVLEKYTIKELSDPSNIERLTADETLIAYGNYFNSPKFQREVINGSGAYEMVDWQTDQRIVLRKKDNWWGEKMNKEEQWYQAYPDTIIYQFIREDKAAVIALRNGLINTMFSVETKTFVEERNKPDFDSLFYEFTPPMYAYDYIGFNLTKPIFEDVNTRKGLAHLMNTPKLIEDAHLGLAQQTVCFSHPTRSEQISSTIKPYEYNLEKAKEYLSQAGWGDSNDDGILDKDINGKLTPFVISMKTNNENDRRKAACKIFAEAAAEVGIEVNIETPVWKSFLNTIRSEKDFDLVVSGWASSPFDSDPKQVWHSSSTSGSNFVNYSNAKVDEAIDAMRVEVDPEKRLPYYHTIHEQIYQDVPYIFLTTQKERIIVSKMFGNVWGTGMKPGFWASGFTVGELMHQ